MIHMIEKQQEAGIEKAEGENGCETSGGGAAG